MQEEESRNWVATDATLKDERTLTIRLLALDDTQALGDFYESVPRKDYRFYCPQPLTRDKAAKNTAAALDPHAVFLVAETGEETIAGIASFRWWEAESPASTFGICVAPAFQDVGLGRAMITRLLEIAREVGPPLMTLTVQKANPRAVALYQRMGFQIVGEQMRRAFEDFPAEPEYRMQRQIR